MIALDEEEFLEDCLRSVAGVVDEIVVGVDNRTIDHTAAIAKTFGAIVIHFGWEDSFAVARNEVLECAHGDWILMLDADERLLPEGAQFIKQVLAIAPDLSPNLHGFSMLVQNVDLEGKPINCFPATARLFRRLPNMRYVGRIHEEPLWGPNPALTTVRVALMGPPHIQHLGYDPIIMERRAKNARDSHLLLMRLKDDPKDAVALYYMALMARDEGLTGISAYFARRALECGSQTLHSDRIPELENLMKERVA